MLLCMTRIQKLLYGHLQFLIDDKKWLTDGDILVLDRLSNENTFVRPLV